MSGGLQNGTYSLRVEADPSPLVGVQFRGVPEQPVVTQAAFRTWIVTKQADGTYILALQDVEGDWFAREAGDEVVAVKGAPATWIVDGPEGGPYTIRAPGGLIPPLAWTVEVPAQPNSPVSLQPLQPIPYPGNQKWYFVAPQ